ncbi:MAG: hypothetical protein M3P98_03275 [bacterium]|nr:hypothetical protein [bacterium]
MDMDFKQPKKKMQTTQPRPTIQPSQQPVVQQAPQTKTDPKQYNQDHIKLNKQVKSKRRGLMIFSFIVVFAAAIAIAVVAYFYLQSRGDTSESKTATETGADQSSLTPQDVDDINSEIDSALESLNDNDFDGAQLDDSAIGL